MKNGLIFSDEIHKIKMFIFKTASLFKQINYIYAWNVFLKASCQLLILSGIPREKLIKLVKKLQIIILFVVIFLRYNTFWFLSQYLMFFFWNKITVPVFISIYKGDVKNCECWIFNFKLMGLVSFFINYSCLSV